VHRATPHSAGRSCRKSKPPGTQSAPKGTRGLSRSRWSHSTARHRAVPRMGSTNDTRGPHISRHGSGHRLVAAPSPNRQSRVRASYPFMPYRISGDDSHSASVAKSAVDDPYIFDAVLTRAGRSPHRSEPARDRGSQASDCGGMARLCAPGATAGNDGVDVGPHRGHTGTIASQRTQRSCGPRAARDISTND
jgi:hypothetical protein